MLPAPPDMLPIPSETWATELKTTLMPSLQFTTNYKESV